jgi:hypothetical protein
MKTLPRTAWLIAAATLILSACASTSLDLTWRDPAYRGRPFGRVLVVGATDDAANRRIYEDALVGALKGRGVDAVASHTLIPAESPVTPAKVVEAVKTWGADSVISTRLIGIETRATQMPTRAVGQTGADLSLDTDLFGYYSSPGSQPIVLQDYRVASLDSNLFDATTGKMVWWGRSSAFPTEDISVLSRELAENVTKSLKSAALL